MRRPEISGAVAKEQVTTSADTVQGSVAEGVTGEGTRSADEVRIGEGEEEGEGEETTVTTLLSTEAPPDEEQEHLKIPDAGVRRA